MEPALENTAGDAAYKARSHTMEVMATVYMYVCAMRCRDKAAHLDAKFLRRFPLKTE